jgi:hypothetical protein
LHRYIPLTPQLICLLLILFQDHFFNQNDVNDHFFNQNETQALKAELYKKDYQRIKLYDVSS